MGLFDTLRCDYPLPDPTYQHAEFQTKDFGGALNHYTITADGRLQRQERTYGLLSVKREPKEARQGVASPERIGRGRTAHALQVEFHGDIRFYLTNATREFIAYRARFTRGRLEWIRLCEAPEAEPPFVRLSELADALDTAGFAYQNVIDSCFGACRRIDVALADSAIHALGDETKAARWLGTPHRELAGDTPYFAVVSGRREEVLKILNAIQHGIPG